MSTTETPRSAVAEGGATAGAVTGAAPGGESPRLTGRLKLVLVILLVAQFMLAVDFSILNVALPAIGDGLGFSLSNLQWVATAFALPAAGFTLFFGRIGDLLGRKRFFVGSLALLGLASLAGGLATSPAVLLAARVAQGLATAAATPAGLSLLTTSFPEGPLRRRALGINGALMSAGFTTGAILGGVLTDVLSWRWAFFVNVPVALAVVVIAPAVISESRPARRASLDLPGALTVTGALIALVFGLTDAGAHSWASTPALASLAAAAVLLAAFFLVERRVAQPLVPLRTLGRRNVAWGNVLGLLAFATETSLVYLLTLYLQKTLGFSPLAAGVSFGVLGLGTVAGGLLAPRVIAATSTSTALTVGALVQTAFTAALLFLGTSTGPALALLLPATFFGGVGNMLVIVAFMVTATSGLPDSEQGLATGLASMSQQVGITLGTPVMSTVVAGAAGASTPAAVHHGVTSAIAVNAALTLLTALLAATFLRPRRR
ncbi:MFS transporter [Streptomyces cocklensis]|jgi:EmrB/QacA subfamily drug resistance transporter|uniref:MFS transporter n=1 Tax=Actinacidiphila cocklensis TaxID=887465 RepID=A0A9W4GR04_9ACTN|nr:MFS transporter [Actinacidiphila cocklensis]MDD1057549.1 MFS transporter [Actinacidiphila cocklensis]CAG6393826.1 MFS transporter [Actinacidiphila cocklensis]